MAITTNETSSNKRASEDVVIDLTGSDKGEDSPSKRRRKSNKTAKVKTERSSNATGASVKSGPSSDNNNEDDDEIEIVGNQDNQVTAPPAAAAALGNNGGDIELVGTKNHVRLPHMRQHCLDHPYHHMIAANNNMRRSENEAHCSECYCYVCDVKASECCESLWKEHCHATDKGPLAAHWLAARRKQAATCKSSSGGAGSSNNPPNSSSHQQQQFMQQASSNDDISGPGPFSPDNVRARRSVILTKCRHCNWYNKFKHRNFAFSRNYMAVIAKRAPRPWDDEIHYTGPMDWCHACGRVASEKDLGKTQSLPFDVTDRKDASNWILLGTKQFKFTLHVHDPRQMTEFRHRWESDASSQAGWAPFDQKAMEQELFDHRFGAHPTLGMIVESLPVVDVEHMPTDGAKRNSLWGYSDSVQSPSETEALLLDEAPQSGTRLLYTLHRASRMFGLQKPGESKDSLTGDIQANWDAANGSGTFTIRVFLDQEANQRAKCNPTKSRLLTNFLGTWFGALPFSLDEIVGSLTAECSASDSYARDKVSVAPFSLDGQLDAGDMKTIEERTAELLNPAKEAASASLESRSLELGKRGSVLGGVCFNEVGFHGVLRRYCRELFPDIAAKSDSVRWDVESLTREESELGLCSKHREMRRSSLRISDDEFEIQQYRHHDDRSEYGSRDLPVLSEADHAIAREHYRRPAKKLLEAIRTQDDVMNHIENLGHAPAPHVEGLTVELLPFQKQSLQWCLERENIPGGIQSFTSVKLPSVEEPETDVYYNLITGQFSLTKPALVRGGILAEQMGLGKTVISLALCLSNPAPEFPASGSKSSSLKDAPVPTPGSACWNLDWKDNLNTSSKRGTILSRGTLVVCKKSLVGQWTEEAKDRLVDPGLVYAYHGSSRRRDPVKLARNAIVVTTYEILASDNTHHRMKSKDPNYCPPCEQVRWWRIICDESHFLRTSGNAATQAVMDLVGDHRWLVSGTPINTTLSDLSSQLSFLGIENVNDMFNVFRKSVFRQIGDRKALNTVHGKRRRHLTAEGATIGPFMFLMRSVMMRHTQNQRYKDTNTTLMSLPPKIESQVILDWSADDAAEYQKMEQETAQTYQQFKRNAKPPVTRHYLKLTAMLMPLRVACAGGKIPLGFEAVAEDDDDEENAKPRRVQTYSKYAYTSKLKRLVEELERVRDSDPTSKSLIFSQFSSTLEWLQEELPNHGFEYRTLSGKMSLAQRTKALREFQNDPPTTIFLLSMRAGAVGINLTEANRVFLMEPCFNPALEAQAVGRVHRLGQKRPVEIVRFFMKDSIDTRINSMLDAKYGRTSGGEGEKKGASENDNEVVGVPFPGSIKSDRTMVVEEEFDLLFGVDSAAGAGEAGQTGDDAHERKPPVQHKVSHEDATIDDVPAAMEEDEPDKGDSPEEDSKLVGRSQRRRCKAINYSEDIYTMEVDEAMESDDGGGKPPARKVNKKRQGRSPRAKTANGGDSDDGGCKPAAKSGKKNSSRSRSTTKDPSLCEDLDGGSDADGDRKPAATKRRVEDDSDDEPFLSDDPF